MKEIPYHMKCFDDVAPVMEILKRSGFTIGLISNMNQKSSSLSKSLGLSQFLDFAITSGEVGFEKPNSAIFLAALEKAALGPAETIHVGDQIASDKEGARKVGINPVLIDRDRNHIPWALCPRIEILSELPSILEDYATKFSST